MIDERIRQLSYSSNLLLHSCPRKYQLYKLNECEEEDDPEASVTFAFGHVVGEGIQSQLMGKSFQETLVSLFKAWKPDLLAENPKQNKSFFKAVFAVEKFYGMRAQGFLDDYELVYYEDKPAVELGFMIDCGDGFLYRGKVDAVLKHRLTGKVMVLELKTTSANVISGAEYKNSAQAIGYSIVLDHLFDDLSEYEVQYLPYLTKSMEYEPMSFMKSYLQRALWIQELLLDIKTIQMYEEAGVYPMRGESCRAWYRDCKHLNTCTMSTPLITAPLTHEKVEEIRTTNEREYPIRVTIQELIEAQLRKELV